MPHQCTNCGRTFPDGSKEMLSGCSSCGGNKFQFQPTVDDESATDGVADTVSSDDGAGTRPGGGPMLSGADGVSPAERGDSGVASTVANAADTVRDWVGSNDRAAAGGEPSDWPGDAASRRKAGGGSEDTAQADARSDVVTRDELPDSATDSAEAVDDERISPADVDFDESGGSTTDDIAPGIEPDDDDASRGPRPESADDVLDRQPNSDRDEHSNEPRDGLSGAGQDDPPDLEALRDELNQQFESIKIVAPGQYELNLMELYDRDEYIISLLEDGRYAIEVPEAWRGAED